MRALIIAAVTFLLASAALAQTGANPAPIKSPGPPRVTAPGETTGVIVKPGGLDNSGPGSNGAVIRGGTGAATVDSDSAAAGNAGKPELGIGNTGGSGGDGGGGGQ
jgi:hypothetical protein